jgi:hypothetical protein
MKQNVGTTDRIIRIIAGLAIGGLGIYFKSWWGILGIIPLFTAAIAWCPLYFPFGISSRCKCDDPNCKCNHEKKEAQE